MAEQQYQPKKNYQPKNQEQKPIKGPKAPEGIEDLLGDIQNAVENSNLSQEYRQQGGQ